MHPLVEATPSDEVTVGVPQASVAVAEPNAALIAVDVGLHPRVDVVPVAVMVGGAISSTHVTVREIVEVLLQPSVAVKVLVCDLLHVVDVTFPSLEVIVGVPQASEAVAAPRAAFIAELLGLHPKFS